MPRPHLARCLHAAGAREYQLPEREHTGPQSSAGSRLLVFTAPRSPKVLLPPGFAFGTRQPGNGGDGSSPAPFLILKGPQMPLPGSNCEEARGQAGQAGRLRRFRVIPEPQAGLPAAPQLPLPTLNLREQQSTKAIFSAGLKAEAQAGENEIRDLFSVTIQRQLRPLLVAKGGSVPVSGDGSPGASAAETSQDGRGGRNYFQKVF